MRFMLLLLVISASLALPAPKAQCQSILEHRTASVRFLGDQVRNMLVTAKRSYDIGEYQKAINICDDYLSDRKYGDKTAIFLLLKAKCYYMKNDPKPAVDAFRDYYTSNHSDKALLKTTLRKAIGRFDKPEYRLREMYFKENGISQWIRRTSTYSRYITLYKKLYDNDIPNDTLESIYQNGDRVSVRYTMHITEMDKFMPKSSTDQKAAAMTKMAIVTLQENIGKQVYLSIRRDRFFERKRQVIRHWARIVGFDITPKKEVLPLDYIYIFGSRRTVYFGPHERNDTINLRVHSRKELDKATKELHRLFKEAIKLDGNLKFTMGLKKEKGFMSGTVLIEFKEDDFEVVRDEEKVKISIIITIKPSYVVDFRLTENQTKGKSKKPVIDNL